MEKRELLKIAIVGPESIGKSELASALANHFKTNWVPEVAREYLEKLNRHYLQSDVEAIAKLQLQLEDEIALKTNGFLICDTNLLVIKIWMESAFGVCPNWILEEIQTRKYDLYLLPDIDLPWVPDPLREHPNERLFFKNWYERELLAAKVPFQIVSGIGELRIENAILAIESHIQK